MKFIEGQYYYCESKDIFFRYIFKATSNLRGCDNIEMRQQRLYRNSGNFNDFPMKNTRLATQQEIIWFELCKKEGKYVEKPIFEEEIY